MESLGYIMTSSDCMQQEEDKKWMREFGCSRIFEEEEANEVVRPVWKQLLIAIKRGDTLVISKFSNAVRGTRELSLFLDFCNTKQFRIISIHDKIDTEGILFASTSIKDVLRMIGNLPHETLAIRKNKKNYLNARKKVIKPVHNVRNNPSWRLQREQIIINMYINGHIIDDIWKASGFKSRSSVFRILKKNNIPLNRGSHNGSGKEKP